MTVAKEIELEDRFQNMGAQMLKQAATKITTWRATARPTATVLAQAIVTEGLRNLAAGANPMLLKRGIDAARGRSSTTSKSSRPVKVTPISSTSPRLRPTTLEIGEAVVRPWTRWVDGVITIEEGKSLKIEVEVHRGMQFDRGYISPYFAE